MYDDNKNTDMLEDFNFSDEALLAASNLQNFTKQINAMYDLKEGTLKIYPNKYFDIKGDINDGYQGKAKDNLILSVVDNSTDPNTLKNAKCITQTVTNNNYHFRCSSGEPINGYIHLASMYDDNKNAINLNMSDGLGSLSFQGSDNSGDTHLSNPTYKKSSSGLSGGAIAGIVIACVVVLVAAAIAAIMLRKPSPPVDNTTVAELKTDNI